MEGQTNFEIIKSMTQEEMAIFIANDLPIRYCCACEFESFCGGENNGGKFNDCCTNAFYQWLNLKPEDKKGL